MRARARWGISRDSWLSNRREENEQKFVFRPSSRDAVHSTLSPCVCLCVAVAAIPHYMHPLAIASRVCACTFTMTHLAVCFSAPSRYKDRLWAHLSDELTKLAFEPHAAQEYSLPLNEGRRQPLPPSQSPEPDEWHLPSTAAEKQPAEGEGQEQRMEQGATVSRRRGAPVRHGHLSSCIVALRNCLRNVLVDGCSSFGGVSK